MTALHVQFVDASETVIQTWFASPQNSDNYPNYGTVETSDGAWKDYYDALSEDDRAYLPKPD